MVHAETCPVCHGIGRIEYVEGGIGTTVRKSQPYHGCHGKGWVEVGSDDSVVVPWGPYVPEPTITVGDWVYESGTYSANVEIALR